MPDAEDPRDAKLDSTEIESKADRPTPDHRQESSITRVKDNPQRAAKRAPLDQDGRERPAFLLNYPDDPALEKLIAAFERGDFMQVRREAPKLARNTNNEEIRKAALELRERIDPDPTLKLFLFAALALLVFIAIWTYV